MYLFQGEFGRVLYTGDFRWELTANKAQLGKKMLLNALGGEKVDVLYLDNTYCHPSFSFPPRDVAAQQVVDIITSYPDHDIVIGIDTLGKEDLLLHISNTLSTKIWVWPERLQIMHLLGFDDIFTTKTSLTRVRAVPRYSLTIEALEAMNTVYPTIGIMPSGFPYSGKQFEECDACLGSSSSKLGTSKVSANCRVQVDKNQFPSPRRYHQHVYSVLYSDHSCFSEIKDFIKLVQPLKMKGIVSSSFCYVNPHQYLGHLCGANQLSDQRYKNLRRNEIANRVEVQTESIFGCEESSKAKTNKERAVRFACLGVRRNRVSLLRRDRRGTKIVENDCGSDCNVGIT